MNIFAGTYHEVLTSADALVGIDLVLVEEKPASEPVREWAARRGKPIEVIPRDRPFPEQVVAGAELLVMASFGRLLDASTVHAIGTVLNFHPGIIQTCRGRHPLPSAILRGDSMMGVTCHVVDSAAIDAGPIVAQIQMPIDYGASYAENDARLRRSLRGLVRTVLGEYSQTGRVVALPWTPAKGTYLPPVDGEVFCRLFAAKQLADLQTA